MATPPLTTLNQHELLLRKLIVAFVVAFFSTLIVALEGLSQEPGYGWSKAAVISLVVGALSAGIRAVLALGPINLTPSDAHHTMSPFK